MLTNNPKTKYQHSSKIQTVWSDEIDEIHWSEIQHNLTDDFKQWDFSEVVGVEWITSEWNRKENDDETEEPKL